MCLKIFGRMTCHVGDKDKEIHVAESSDDDFVIIEPKVNQHSNVLYELSINRCGHL